MSQRISVNRLWTKVLTATLASAVVVGNWGRLQADEPEKTQQPKPDKYALPEDGGPAELAEFIERLQGLQLTSKRKARTIHGRIIEAADKILASENVEDELAVEAVQAKFNSLRLSERYGGDPAGPAIDELLQLLKTDPRAAIQQEYICLNFQNRYAAAQRTRTLVDKVELLNDMTAALDEHELNLRLFRVYRDIIWLVERAGGAGEAAGGYRALATAAADCELEKIADYTPRLEGAARRLELVGGPIDIEGVTVNDEAFDLQSYRGKVVLIDYWATWCGPCIRELPNLTEHYEQYHDQGFEVVGISLDDDREALDKFLEKREIPWTTLHGTSTETIGWDHPMALRYGVMSIPTVILVDQEGKVVSLRARGAFLGPLLRRLLGPPRGEPVEAQKPLNLAVAGD